MIQNLIFEYLEFFFFFENIISGSGIQLFYTRPYVSVDIIRAFLKFLNFLTQSLKANKN